MTRTYEFIPTLYSNKKSENQQIPKTKENFQAVKKNNRQVVATSSIPTASFSLAAAAGNVESACHTAFEGWDVNAWPTKPPSRPLEFWGAGKPQRNKEIEAVYIGWNCLTN